MTRAGPERLTLEEAAERLDVHYMTVYRYVRLGRLEATRDDGRWWIERAALDAMVRRTRPSRSQNAPSRWRDQRRRLLRRMDDGDLGGAWTVLQESVPAGRPPVALYVRLLAPVLAQVGDEWASGARSIESEHRVSSIAVHLVGRLGVEGLHPGRPRRATVVLGGAPGDAHQMPSLMVADVLRWEGYRVVDLGADVPLTSFVDAASATPDLVAVGVSLSATRHRRAAASVLAHLGDAVPEAILLAGGPALPDEASALALGAHGWAADAGAVAPTLASLR
jgi:MerR family transcriptional regulator, light-induced transcriptional regulator